MTIVQIKNLSYRPQDLVYDPLFVVSGPRDHYKAAVLAKMSMAKYACLGFSENISDYISFLYFPIYYVFVTYLLSKYVLFSRICFPISRVILVNNSSFEEQEIFLRIKSRRRKATDISDKFIASPTLYKDERDPNISGERKQKMAGGGKHENVQTDFRESEMQTSPWQPDYTLINNDGSASPQLLKLDFLKWGSGLPAGKAEVALVERARMKRAWEKHLPPPTDEATLKKRRDIIEAMERDEWAFREQEIQEIQELRMKLLEEMLAELHRKAQDRSDLKLRNISEIRKAETDDKIKKLRMKTERELRKLDMKHRGLNPKYHITDIVEDHAHPKSELYAPLMRHGEHPMRWHQVMDDRLKYYKAQFIGVEDFSTLPKWLNKATILKDDYNTTKLPGTRICMRATKWTTPVLKKLHEELKNLRKTTKHKCTLRVRIEKTISEASTPETSELADSEEDKYQALVSVQSILKGRASQMLIYEGRDKCRELIKELKYSTGLLDEQIEVIGKKRKQIKHQQREESLQSHRVAKLHRSLNKLEGSIVGSLLDFLNKELRRLLDERRAHAICFLNERERNDREAAEAGRRQQELRRRREHDEIFKQMVKVHQDTVDLYLQDIITEGIEFASNDEALFYVKKFVDKIENENAEQLERSIDITEQEETIADLVHHFVLPEVQKQLVRDRIKKKQRERLRRVNDTLLDDLLEQIPDMNSDAARTMDELPSTGFKFKYQTEREIMENLWGDEEQSPIISGPMSVMDEVKLSSEYSTTSDYLQSEDTVSGVKRVKPLMAEAQKESAKYLSDLEGDSHYQYESVEEQQLILQEVQLIIEETLEDVEDIVDEDNENKLDDFEELGAAIGNISGKHEEKLNEELDDDEKPKETPDQKLGDAEQLGENIEDIAKGYEEKLQEDAENIVGERERKLDDVEKLGEQVGETIGEHEEKIDIENLGEPIENIAEEREGKSDYVEKLGEEVTGEHEEKLNIEKQGEEIGIIIKEHEGKADDASKHEEKVNDVEKSNDVKPKSEDEVNKTEDKNEMEKTIQDGDKKEGNLD